MDLDLVNAELQVLSEEEIQAKIDVQYEDFLEEMYQLWAMEQYADDCYDLDAEFYGVW